MNPSLAISRVLAAWRRLPGWLQAVLLFAAVHLVWLLLGFERTRGRQLYDRIVLDLLYTIAAWRFLRAAARPELPDRTRLGLRFIAAGMAMGSVATAYLLVERFVRPAPPSVFSAADALFLGLYPVILTGVGLLPRGERLAAGAWRITLDGIVFVVGLGFPLWVFAIAPDLESSHGVDTLLLVAWPVVALCGVFGINAGLLTRAPLPSRGALWLLMAALGLSWFGDLVFTLDAAANVITRAAVNWINVVNAIFLALAILAAWRFESDPMPAGKPERPASFSPVPLLTIAIVSAWLVFAATSSSGIALERIVPSLVVLFAVLFIRETLVMRDSLRWVAAEAQREGQERFEALVRNSSDIIMIVDAGLSVRFASPAATGGLAVAPERLAGRSLPELVHPEDAEAGRQFATVLGGSYGTSAFVRWRLRHADGSYRHFETAGANLLRESSIGGLVLNLRDISERVVLEERLHHAEKMEAVGRLAGGVAHDFNNLLAVMLANSELALLALPPEHEAWQEVSEIRRATTRGAALTSRLLSFSRREGLAPSVVSPAELVQGLTPVLQRLAGVNLAIATRLAPDAGMVKVNPDALEQALINLTANARDASPQGSTLTLSVRNAVLAEPLATPYLTAPPGRYVVIEAADTGSGMDEATRARLFEPFFTTKPRGKGTGLGLASIYGTVKASAGGLTVETAPGKGTTFGIWLPEVTEKPAVAPSTESAPPIGGSETILLVEDETGVRTVTQRILQTKGYRVMSACDADDARQVLSRHSGRVHLLLTDVIMPGQSGPALASELVRARPDLRVLFMSGYTGHELEAHGLGNATNRLLVKPFTVEQLTVRLRETLSGPPGLS